MNVYRITDAEGIATVLEPGQEIVSQEQRIDTAEESAFALGAPIGSYVACQVQIPYWALDGFDDELLARWKITRQVVADPPPPPAPRAELRKSTVVARLDAIGKLAPVWSILNAQPILFAQWFAPDWPNVYCDDAGMLQVFQAAGLTAEQIATVTA